MVKMIYEVKDSFDKYFLHLGMGKHIVDVIDTKIWSEDNPIKLSTVQDSKGWKFVVRTDKLNKLAIVKDNK